MVPMKLTAGRKRTVSIVALALAAILGLDVIYQFSMHAVWRRWLPSTLATAAATAQPVATQPADTQPADTQPADTQPADTQPATSQPAEPPAAAQGETSPPDAPESRELHAAIRKRNVFAPYQPRRHGLALTGVLGNIALFSKGDKTIGIEEGKSEGDVKVVSICGYEVTIEFDGKPETMALFTGSSAAPPSSPPEPAPQQAEGPPPTEAGLTSQETPPYAADEATVRAASEAAQRRAIEAHRLRPIPQKREAD